MSMETSQNSENSNINAKNLTKKIRNKQQSTNNKI